MVISRANERPAWAKPGNWIEVPDSVPQCILCQRAYCPKAGETFKAPDIYFGKNLPREAPSAVAVAAASQPEGYGQQERVAGMWPAQQGVGSSVDHRKSRLARIAERTSNFVLVPASGSP